MARSTHRETVEAALVAVFARNGFRNRDGEVWTREHGPVQDWAALEIHDVNRRTELAVDAIVGVRVDPVERLLAQILGERTRRRVPTWVQRLAQQVGRVEPGGLPLAERRLEQPVQERRRSSPVRAIR